MPPAAGSCSASAHLLSRPLFALPTSLLAVEHVEEDGKAMLYLVRARTRPSRLHSDQLSAGF